MATKEVKRIHDSLELEEDLIFQRRQWTVQRGGWIVMLLIGAAALAGLLGRGPLSSTTRTDPTGALTIRYNRFEHNSAATELHVQVTPAKAKDGKVRVWIDSDYLSEIRVTSMSPPPLHVEQQAGRHVYTFACDGRGTLDLTIHYEHQDWGKAEGKVGLAEGTEELAISQVVYP
jgi:hypothetical protein